MARRTLESDETESGDSTDPRHGRWFRGTKQDEVHACTLQDSLEDLRYPFRRKKDNGAARKPDRVSRSDVVDLEAEGD